MPNEEILTSLKNAIEHGDSLQNAMQILINSGYNPYEVQEASKYVSGITTNLYPSEDEMIMPGKLKKKSFFSKSNIFEKKQKPAASQEELLSSKLQSPQLQPQRQFPKSNFLTQGITPTQKNESLAKQLKKIQPPRKSYFKEIILLMVLIILVGILITTIIFRDNILRFFSG